MKRVVLLPLLGVIPLAPNMTWYVCSPDDVPDLTITTCSACTSLVVPLDEDTPLAPSDLSLTTVTIPIARYNSLEWTDNSHNEDGFWIWRKGPSSDWDTIDTVEANQPLYDDRTASGDSYSYRIQAFNTTPSNFSNVAGAEATESPVPPLTAPSNLVATPGDDYLSVLLTWTDNAENVTCFEVERTVDEVGGSYTGWAGFQRIGLVADTCFVDEDVDPSRRPDLPYVYRVRAYYLAPTDAERSAYSNIASAVPDPEGMSAPRLEIDISGLGTGQVAGEGVGCSSRYCTGVFSPGDTVTLTAVPWWYSTLGSWAGCDSVEGENCIVIMDGSKNITLTFDRTPLPPPVLSGPAEATTWYYITWSWDWPPGAGFGDSYVLEYSYDGVDYQELTSYFGTHVDVAAALEEFFHPIADEIGITTYYRVKASWQGRETPYSNVIGVYCPYVEMIYDPTHDNLVQDVSSDGEDTQPPHYRDTVFEDSELAVGTIWNFDGTYTNSASALRFDDLEYYIAGGTIESASLIFTPDGYFIPVYGATTFRVNPFQGAWDPDTLTYMTLPPAYETPFAEVIAASALQTPWLIDITSIVQTWADGTPNHGILLWDTDMQWHTGADIIHPGYATWSLATVYSNDTAPTVAELPTLYLVIR